MDSPKPHRLKTVICLFDQKMARRWYEGAIIAASNWRAGEVNSFVDRLCVGAREVRSRRDRTQIQDQVTFIFSAQGTGRSRDWAALLGSATGKKGHPRKVAQLNLDKQAHVMSPPLHLRLNGGFRLRR